MCARLHTKVCVVDHLREKTCFLWFAFQINYKFATSINPFRALRALQAASLAPKTSPRYRPTSALTADGGTVEWK
jgi:hypothetical protein